MTESGRGPWEARLREGVERVEDELRHLIGRMNDEVVPDVRRNGSQALRAVAAELARLAEKIDDANRGATPPRER